jgi:hypothetical protein
MWSSLLNRNQFAPTVNDERSETYRTNPENNLELLAKARQPVSQTRNHIIGPFQQTRDPTHANLALRENVKGRSVTKLCDGSTRSRLCSQKEFFDDRSKTRIKQRHKGEGKT